ncbi:ATP-binding protein [Martelella alba]|uniref:histidine kinase n=1 Tax=Martelella alba TaxID=2590451 RepID=A0ABY2SLX4_9HYPH|nr:ATP-binding protein [Martelella alba]TKI06606.1 PAS domain-containing protein [Martelella alba]
MSEEIPLLARRPNPSTALSPWLLLGLSVILGLAIAILALRNTEREKHYLTENLLNRAEALISSVEAGARASMGFRDDDRLLQSLLEETGRQAGVRYLMVVDSQGRIIAHSDAAQVGGIRPELANLAASTAQQRPDWRFVKAGDGRLFEAYQLFTPASGHRAMMMNMMGMGGDGDAATDGKMSIFVGLDPAPAEAAFSTDQRNNLVVAALVTLLGLGGFVSLFWAHNSRLSGRLLRDTQALAAEVITSLPLGLLTSDSGGRVILANDAARNLLGDDVAQGAGTPLEGLGGLDWRAVLAALERGDKWLEREMELDTARKGTVPVSLSASQIRNDEGARLGYLFILRDLTQVKQLQADVRRNERLTALGHMAAGVAHEIRNPLSSIKGLATYLSAKFAGDGPEKRAAGTMILEVDRLNRVVSELLDFARPGEMPLTRAEVNPVIAHALRLADADARARRVALTFAPDPALPLLPLNAERVTQALLNLLINAIQAVPEGGTVGVTTHVDARRRQLDIAVKDNGGGIPPEIVEAIFTPYFTTKSSGTGLGLAIVQQIAEGHRGKATVVSRPGAGSVFTLSLPLGDANEE